jgi:hypothetical protein
MRYSRSHARSRSASSRPPGWVVSRVVTIGAAAGVVLAATTAVAVASGSGSGAAAPVGDGAAVEVGHATIVPTAKTTAAGPATVRAKVVLTQTGGLLSATGTGTGFTRDGIYLSVLYGPRSNATTCTPDGSLDFGQMLLGIWEPTGSTTRTLVAPTKLDRGFSGVKLDQVRYVSIRETSTMRVASTAQQLGQTFQLAACGTITTVSTPPVTLPPVTLPPVTLPPVTLPPVTVPTLPPVTLAPHS